MTKSHSDLISTKNLSGVIKTIEELVLSVAGVEPFEEVLKLIYAKLYAEKTAQPTLPAQLLFSKAKKEWPGIFDKKDKIELSSTHLTICMEELGKITLYKTDLSIIDTAFEYLLPKSAKGSRGQYFTPRHIIAQVLKILNPKKDEHILDPACGSGGFLLHAATMAGTNSQKIYGIDFDKRMVNIAKAIVLISGFGNINIYKANSLVTVKEVKDNSFDIVCTNPPFGGEVRDESILKEYELAKNNQEKVLKPVERHILFIERIIRFLKPGGRTGIIVPQGILNNTRLAYIREWLFTKARIIGVIGLDANTFKPHTNVKTSLLFLQKWRGKELIDYPIFMAVSSKSGKNLSGEYIYKIKNGEKIIDHDLGEIAQKFREFISKEKLNF